MCHSCHASMKGFFSTWWCSTSGFVLLNKVIKECCTPYLCGRLFFDFIPDFACSVSNTQDLGTKNSVSSFSLPLLILLKSFLWQNLRHEELTSHFRFHAWFTLASHMIEKRDMGCCAGHKSRKLTMHASLVCAHYLFPNLHFLQPIMLKLLIVA